MSADSHHHEQVCYADDRRRLYIVLALNFAMFALEVWQGFQADSTSLLADSMDFLSDSFSYAITLYVLSKALATRAKASLLKAGLMLLLAAGALGQGVYNLVHHQTPEYITMGWVGALALTANVVSALILYKSRGRDSNMHSVWLCSRNDAIANIAIIIAAGLVYVTGTLWPDLAVALIIAWLEGGSALKIIAHAKKELQHAK
jgi:Co/Zn/Cd efflux system component